MLSFQYNSIILDLVFLSKLLMEMLENIIRSFCIIEIH